MWVQDQKLWNGPPRLEKILLVFHQKRPIVMHTAKWEKCQILWKGPFHGMDPPDWNYFKFISQFRTKSCGMNPKRLEKNLNSFLSSGSKVVEWTPRIWHLVEIFEILLLHVLSNDACKFTINLFPISWGPFENVHLLYFLLKMQIWNGHNVLNIAGNPIKDINVNLSFFSLGSKVVEWTPKD